MRLSTSKLSSGFSIVELLVAIVVIGILATITIVSYNGISNKAVVASINSDLDGAAKQIKMYQVINGIYPNDIDCSATPIVNTICIRFSPGNSYTYYKSDNTTSPQVFSLYATNGTVPVEYRVTDNSKAMTFDNSYTSCLAILNGGGSVGNGIYKINPTGTVISVYCDMANGGWTRLNNNISTSTTLFDNNDLIVTNNVPGICGSPGCAFTVNNISVTHTSVRAIMTRTTSIVQCPALNGVTISSQYWNGSGWTTYGTCRWSDGIFANAISTDMTNLKLMWKFEGLKAVSGEIKFISSCSSSDSGQIRVTAWVK